MFVKYYLPAGYLTMFWFALFLNKFKPVFRLQNSSKDLLAIQYGFEYQNNYFDQIIKHFA